MATTPKPKAALAEVELLTAEQRLRALSAIGAGADPVAAIAHQGIHPVTAEKFVLDAMEAADDTPEGKFWAEVLQAQHRAQVSDFAVVAQAARQDWRAAAWRMQQREKGKATTKGKHVGRPSREEVAEHEHYVWERRRNSVPARIIAKELGLNESSVHQIYQRCLQRLSPDDLVEAERKHQLEVHERIAQLAMEHFEQTGDSAFLQRAVSALAGRRKVLPGVEAPTVHKVEAAQSEIDKLIEGILGTDSAPEGEEAADANA